MQRQTVRDRSREERGVETETEATRQADRHMQRQTVMDTRRERERGGEREREHSTLTED